MFVCRHGRNATAHSRLDDDKKQKRTETETETKKVNYCYWRFDSINIYHNHKIKIASKAIDCNLIGRCVSSGRGLVPDGWVVSSNKVVHIIVQKSI